VEPFTAAARKGASEFALLVPVKARPVLVITEVLPEHEEVLALRLRHPKPETRRSSPGWSAAAAQIGRGRP
jgi:hypothetical protein